MTNFTRIIAICVLCILTIIACGSDKTNPTVSGLGPDTVINNPDDFQYQATGNHDVSLLLDFNWENSGTQATITHSSTVDSGTALLYLYDGSGQLVYSNGLSASSVEQSQVGTAGTWLVRVSMNTFWGDLSFRVQKLN